MAVETFHFIPRLVPVTQCVYHCHRPVCRWFWYGFLSSGVGVFLYWSHQVLLVDLSLDLDKGLGWVMRTFWSITGFFLIVLSIQLAIYCLTSKFLENYCILVFVSGPGLVPCFVCVRNCVLFLYVYSILLNISKFLLISAIGPVEHVLDLNSWPDQPCCWDLIFLLGTKSGHILLCPGSVAGKGSVIMCHFCSTVHTDIFSSCIIALGFRTRFFSFFVLIHCGCALRWRTLIGCWSIDWFHMVGIADESRSFNEPMVGAGKDATLIDNMYQKTLDLRIMM